jgi:uncharacterized protein YjbI with pentapeptide repeats
MDPAVTIRRFEAHRMTREEWASYYRPHIRHCMFTLWIVSRSRAERMSMPLIARDTGYYYGVTGLSSDLFVFNKPDDFPSHHTPFTLWIWSRGRVIRTLNLRCANFRGAYWHGLRLQGADAQYANLNYSRFSLADFRGANLRGASFRRSFMGESNFEAVDLRDTNFYLAYLPEANFRAADLRNSDLRYANVCGADFRGANLQNADLRKIRFDDETDFRGANLCGALPARGKLRTWLAK